MYSVHMCVQVSLNQVSTKEWYSWSYANFYTFALLRIVCTELQIRLFSLEHRQDFTLVPFPIPSRYYFSSFLEGQQNLDHFHWKLPAQYIALVVDWIICVLCSMFEFFVYYTNTHPIRQMSGKDFFLFCGLYLHYADHPFIVQNTFWLYYPLSFLCYCVATRFSCSFYNEHLFSQQFVEWLSDTRY